MLEEERKYDVGVDFTLPALKSTLPAVSPVTADSVPPRRPTVEGTTSLRRTLSAYTAARSLPSSTSGRSIQSARYCSQL